MDGNTYLYEQVFPLMSVYHVCMNAGNEYVAIGSGILLNIVEKGYG